MSATMTTPAKIVGYTLMTPTSQEQIKRAYDKVMKKYKPPENVGPLEGSGTPPGRGGAPPGGGENPGGGGPPARGNLAGRAQTPSNKMWGSLPNHFNGTRSKANDFIDKLKSYFHINQLNAGLQSPITKAAFALTLIKGPKVAG
jgi:hypothetical protein